MIAADSGPALRYAGEYRQALELLWIAGLPPGDKTGWPSLDKHYTVAPGQLTIITGWPGAGKSEFLDALAINLSRQQWKFAVFSAENQPVEIHLAKMMEKLAGEPFAAGPTERIAENKIPRYLEKIAASFAFIEPSDEPSTLNKIIESSESWLLADDGLNRGLIVDPWNEIEHWRRPGLSETEFVSEQLSLIRNWARRNRIHVWIVAHPQKVPRENGKLPIPRPDMISGSQHWWNKADCAITVWRDLEKPDSQAVDIYVQKVRFKHVGRPGLVTLDYDRVTGRYNEQRKAPAAVASYGYKDA